ncbi:MAG: ABC-F family ATP-binding cassette domain-containing protein [Bacteroidales bacterium]|nr:ABC-F family ATP-binding cassette domain-containing protein [Bacteroidales bacterium]
MISINNLTVSFGGFDLFKEISFLVNPKDRIGLTGKNGAGKSTLLKIIYGIDQPTKGSIAMPKDITIGYLPQKMKYPIGLSVWDEAATAFAEINNINKEIEQLNNEITHRTDYESEGYEKLISRAHELNDRIHILGAGNTDAILEKTLTGLGFESADFNRLTTEFSGGWRMRIELAKILLKQPDVLLLDEPTNHLDIESIQWLEDFLKEYNGAVVMVSHDRAFLDNITKRTVEISLGKIYDYKVSYTKYVELRKERIAQQLAAYENQQKSIADTEKFIERFRYKATKAVQVQSRIKQLDKIDRIEIDDEDNSSIYFHFPPAPRSGNLVIETDKLTKKYGNKTILKDIELIVERGEKIAFVGRNGEGKSTLSKIIIQELDFEGNLKIGHNVNIGYYAQNQDELLDESKTVFETLDDIAKGDARKKVRNILGSFLFSGETVDKKVQVLSGGERSRLALAKLLLEPYNLLVLDEPTNHLDIRSKEILKKALLEYDGTLIIVSHDRDFLDGLTEKLYEFKNQKIKEFRGSIYEFLNKKKISSLKEIEIKESSKTESKREEISDNKLNYLERKEFDKKKRKIINQIKKAEEEISDLEDKISKAEEKISLCVNSDDFDFFKEYEKNKNQLEKTIENWEKLNEELENFGSFD